MISVYRLVSASIAVAMLVTPTVSRSACSAQSGTHTAALVELYTSEGCSSCPPADDELRRIRQVVGPSSDVVALAMHVDYWDSLGWKDPYAQNAFAVRQRSLVQQHDGTTVYTPHFFISGDPLLAWQRGLPDAVHRLNARPAASRISTSRPHCRRRARLRSTPTLRRAQHRVPRRSTLQSRKEWNVVKSDARRKHRRHARARSRGARVDRPPPPAGRFRHEQRTVTLPDDWNALHLEVVGFVADESHWRRSAGHKRRGLCALLRGRPRALTSAEIA